MQVISSNMQESSIRDFRRDLRILEREVVRQLAQETDCCGVSLAQCHTLLELSFSELSLTGLAAALDLDTSTLSRTVDGLVKAGLVERTEDAADRRSLRLSLTPSGSEKVAAIDEMCDRYYTELLEHMSKKDQQCVVRGLRLLADLMRCLRSPQQGGCGKIPQTGEKECQSASSVTARQATLRLDDKKVSYGKK